MSFADLFPRVASFGATLAALGALLAHSPAAGAADPPANEALPALERRVMLEADNVGAWLDFARAYEELGHREEARAIYDFIEAELSPDAAARADIARRRQSTALAFGVGRWHADITLLGGRESNANVGPAVSELAVSLGPTPAVLVLDPRFRPQPSSSALAEFRLEGVQPLANGTQLSAYADWRERHAPGAPTSLARQRQLRLALSGRFDSQPWGWSLEGALFSSASQQETLIRTRRAAARLERPWAVCRLQGGVEIEQREYPAAPILDGRDLGLVGILSCPVGDSLLQLAARLARDTPEGERAGGAQTRQELNLAWSQPGVLGGRLEALASFARSTDASGYSPLFNDAARHIRRTQLRLEYVRPVAAGFEALVRAERFSQAANIGLFQVEGNSLHLGLRRSF